MRGKGGGGGVGGGGGGAKDSLCSRKKGKGGLQEKTKKTPSSSILGERSLEGDVTGEGAGSRSNQKGAVQGHCWSHFEESLSNRGKDEISGVQKKKHEKKKDAVGGPLEKSSKGRDYTIADDGQKEKQ